MRIGVDFMGGESPATELLAASIEVASQMDPGHVVVPLITRKLSHQFQADPQFQPCMARELPGIEPQIVGESIGMAENPLFAFKRKPCSSLTLGVMQIKEGAFDALVTLGNTGALITAAAFNLPRLPGIERPALLTRLPSLNRPTVLIDCGGVISCRASHLVQFAQLGVAYRGCFETKEAQQAKVGLLNIGVESKKGRKEIRQAFDQLTQAVQQKETHFDFVGNIEGQDVYRGIVDVLVADGFSGNVLLKTSEGLSAVIFHLITQSMQKENASLTLQTCVKKLQRRFCCDEYPGALVWGVEGIIVKCHGAVSAYAMKKSILWAASLVKLGVIDSMRNALSRS